MPPARKIPWHSLSRDTVIAALKTDAVRGLSLKEARKRIERMGKNSLEGKKRLRLFDTSVSQAKDPLALILFFAGVIAFVLGSYLDTIVIFFALAVNVSLGALLKWRAGKAFARLHATQKKFSSVIREERRMEILSENIAPGDILILEAGRTIGADARLLEAKDLSVNEAILSGEWMPGGKDANKKVSREALLPEQTTMVWMGTLVATGTGKAVVVRTGARTQFGKIAKSIQKEIDRETPLQKQMKRGAFWITGFIVVAVAFVFTMGVFRGEALGPLFFLVVAIAVTSIPAGLPAAVTVVLALGMEKILSRGGLLKNLLGTETLGSTTVILIDKTGTLTEAKMRVRTLAAATTLSRMEEDGQNGAFRIRNQDEETILLYAVAASDGFIEWNLAQKSDEKDAKESMPNEERFSREGADGTTSSFAVRGRPVERAILLAGMEAGMFPEKIEKRLPRVDFLKFESERQFAASLHRDAENSSHKLIFVGAPEYLLAHAGLVLGGGKKIRMGKVARETLFEFAKQRSRKGERLIAVAHKDVREKTIPATVKERFREYKDSQLVFDGFLLLADPIRKGAASALSDAGEAGIRIVMVTGDNPHTAAHVASLTGIQKEDGPVALGEDIEKASDSELLKLLARGNVFARVLPQEKRRLVEVLQKAGEVVAMTGDGINDAPSLAKADIGIALGSSTDVAKESADLVLLENGLQVIVETVRVGRQIMDNVKKIVTYLLSTSFSELLLVGSALAVSGPLPLLPTQILWINIIESGFMNFSFAFEPEERDVMRRDPQAADEGALTGSLRILILLIALITGSFLITLYFWLRHIGMPLLELRTVLFVAVSVDSIFFSFSIKNLKKPLWKIPIFSNKYLLVAISLSGAALFAALTVPPLQTLLSLSPFSSFIFFLIVGLGIMNVAIIEIAKKIVFRGE